MMRKFCKFSIATMIMTGSAIAAPSIIVDINGESPNRRAVYASINVVDRTPLDSLLSADRKSMSLERINEVDVDVVFEAPGDPEWAEMVLQFKCLPESSGKITDKEKKLRSAAAGSMNVFRFVSGSAVARNWKASDLPASDWQPVADHMMRQLQKLACNSVAVNNAVQAASEKGQFNSAVYRNQVAAIDFKDSTVVSDSTYGKDLSDLTWKMLWIDGKRPAMDGGRKLTAAEQAEYEQKFADAQKQMDGIVAQAAGYAKPKIEQMNADAAFAKKAASIRGDRKLGKKEASAIMVWQGRTEEEVVIAMGPPLISDTDSIRFLTYTQELEVPTTVLTDMQSGAQQIHGGQYARCDVLFMMTRDDKGVSRVADIRIKSQWDDAGLGARVCDGLVEVPLN